MTQVLTGRELQLRMRLPSERNAPVLQRRCFLHHTRHTGHSGHAFVGAKICRVCRVCGRTTECPWPFHFCACRNRQMRIHGGTDQSIRPASLGPGYVSIRRSPNPRDNSVTDHLRSECEPGDASRCPISGPIRTTPGISMQVHDTVRTAGELTPLLRLFRANWRPVTLTYSLYNVENLLNLAHPFVLGVAINGLLRSEYGGLGLLVGQHLAHLFVGTARQMYDTRASRRSTPTRSPALSAGNGTPGSASRRSPPGLASRASWSISSRIT